MTTERATALARDRSDPDIGAFVAEHYDRLLGLTRLICRDASDAGDALQIGLEQAWRKRASLRDESKLRQWIDRIVVREAVRISRSRQSWLGRILSPSTDVQWIEFADPRGQQPQEYTAIRAAFARLSADQRAVVALHLHLGYSVAETAEIVGAALETVRSRLRLAKERLRHELGEPR
ncbi:MAG: RNA polymerase sigma factor [Aeromicrobium sp.]